MFPRKGPCLSTGNLVKRNARAELTVNIKEKCILSQKRGGKVRDLSALSYICCLIRVGD